ncbi:MAG: NAD(P)H-binding protein, partial [bacterium]
MSSGRAEPAPPERPIAVTGAGGFVGSHLVPLLRSEGFSIRAVVRTTRDAPRLRGLGCEIAVADVRSRPSLTEAFAGCAAVVHLVAIIRERAGQTYDGINREGAANTVAAAREAGVGRFLHMSALGAGPNAPRYLRSKWAGEEQIRRGGVPFVIVRPSFLLGSGGGSALQFAEVVRFGPWYPFVQLFGGRKVFGALAALTPVVPVLGSGQYRSMPVAIADVIRVVRQALDRNDITGRTFEIGGPEVLTYDALMTRVAQALGVRRRLLHLPDPAARAVIAMFAALPNPPITRDEAESLFIDTLTD